jgi:hypothetical protein
VNKNEGALNFGICGIFCLVVGNIIEYLWPDFYAGALKEHEQYWPVIITTLIYKLAPKMKPESPNIQRSIWLAPIAGLFIMALISCSAPPKFANATEALSFSHLQIIAIAEETQKAKETRAITPAKAIAIQARLYEAHNLLSKARIALCLTEDEDSACVVDNALGNDHINKAVTTLTLLRGFLHEPGNGNSPTIDTRKQLSPAEQL